MWWEGAAEVDPDSTVYLEYSYTLGQSGENLTSYWAWDGGRAEWHATPKQFLAEIRVADTLHLRSVGFPEPFEADFDLAGIEWAISMIPCVE